MTNVWNEHLRDVCEVVEAARLRAASLSTDGEKVLTERLCQYLNRHAVRTVSLWNHPRVDRCAGPAHAMFIHAVPYSDAPRASVVRAISRLLDELIRLPLTAFGDAALFLFHVAGPICRVPARLECERAGLSLISVDIAEPSETVSRAILTLDDLRDALGELMDDDGQLEAERSAPRVVVRCTVDADSAENCRHQLSEECQREMPDFEN